MPGVLLGSIQFQNREIPDTMKAGSKQMLAIHRVMGGNRVIDAIGPDFPPIKWSGLFYGANAMARARACDELCRSGAEVNLYFGSNAYLVVVEDFDYNYKHEWEVRYSISCQVVGIQAPIALPTLDQTIATDFAAINAISTAAPAVPAVTGAISVPSSLATAITTAQNATITSTSIIDLSLAQLQPIVNAVNDAFATLQSTIGSPTNGIDLSAETATSVIDGINAFASEATLRAVESDLETISAYLGRIVGNIDMAGG